MRQRFLTGSLFVIATFLIFYLGHRWWERLNQPTVLCPGCNVIIVDIDTFRADSFDCKGKPGDRGNPTNLCEFVKDAFKFENNFAQSHWTLPSSVSTHTGLYPPEHGIEQYGDILPAGPKTVILPEVFLKNGYKTFKVGYDGKQFISNRSNANRGYESNINSEDMTVWKEEVVIMSLSKNQFYALFYFSGLHVPYLLDEDNSILDSQDRSPFFPITKKEFDKSVEDFLLRNFDVIFTKEARVIPKTKLSEFFYSIRNNEELIRKYLIRDWDTTYYSEIISSLYKVAIDEDSDSVEKIHEVYNSNIHESDKQLSPFLDELKSPEIMKNSVIVFMSDHGEAFREHGYFEHVLSPGSQYNELIHVPLYIYIPGVKGKAIKIVSQNIDIFPTLFEIVGLEDFTSTGVNHGKSLVPLMDGQRWWSNLQKRFAISFSGSLLSIQDGKWKIIADLCDDGRLEVYDLENDPIEKKNLAKSVTGVSRVLMDRLEETLGFSLKGLGINWKDRFGSNRNSSCFVN